MSENTSKKHFADGRDILFGTPDTGIRVSWDFSAGCGKMSNILYFSYFSPARTTFLRPIMDVMLSPAFSADYFWLQVKHF